MHQLDIFKPTGINTQVFGLRDVQYLPVSAIQENASITFHRSASLCYLNSSKIHFETVVEIIHSHLPLIEN